METGWRITAENPVRPLPHLDAERCIALHNEIIARSVMATSGNSDLSNMGTRTWWDHNEAAVQGSEAGKLHSSLVTFLQGAVHSWNADDSDKLFFYNVNGLVSWSGLFDALLNDDSRGLGANPSDDEGEGADDAQPDRVDFGQYRFVWLYVYGGLDVSHILGIVYDQLRHRAIMSPSIWDLDTAASGRIEWLPLEAVLDAWLTLMDRGKIVAAPSSTLQEMQDDDEDMAAVAHQWRMLGYSQLDLDETVAAWDALVDAIHARTGSNEPADGDASLVDEAALADTRISRFHREFLLRAKRPPFRRVAPGLMVPTQEQVLAALQRRSLGQDENAYRFPPWCFLVADEAPQATITIPQRVDEDESLFSHKTYWIDSEAQFSPGLYVTGIQEQENDLNFADTFKLILPYRIGTNGHARRSDGSFLAEYEDTTHAVLARPTHSQLYQPGYNPVWRSHEAQLVHLFQNWRQRVEDEHWSVSADGVSETIDKFREADTEERWHLYQLPLAL